MRKNPDPAFVSLLRAQQESLLRAARLLTGEWATAEDLLQDTFAWALGAWQSLAESGTAPLRVRQRMVSVYLADAAAAAAEQDEDDAADEEYDDDAASDDIDEGPAADYPGDPDGDAAGADEPGSGGPWSGAGDWEDEPTVAQQPPDSASLVAGLRVLSAEDRAVVVSRYYLGLSAAEIGEVLDVDAEDVDATAVSVLAALRRGAVGVGGSG